MRRRPASIFLFAIYRSFLWCMPDWAMNVKMHVDFVCQNECHVCMSSNKYPLRGCDSEWGKQPYGVLSPSPNLPLKERVGEFRSLRRATRALPLTRKPLKRLERNFNTGARRMRSTLIGYVCENAVVRPSSYAGRTAGSSYATEAAISGVYCECWASHAAGSRRKMPAGAPRPPHDLQKSAYCVILILYSKRIEVQL